MLSSSLSGTSTKPPSFASPTYKIAGHLYAAAWQLGVSPLNAVQAALSIRFLLTRRVAEEEPSAAGGSDAMLLTSTDELGDDDECSETLPPDSAHWCHLAANAYSVHEPHFIAGASGGTDAVCPGLAQQHFLYVQLETLPLLPAHAIVMDTVRRVVYITIRGTTSVADQIADLAGCIVDMTSEEPLPAVEIGPRPGTSGPAPAHATPPADLDAGAPIGVHAGVHACAASFMTQDYSAAAMERVVARAHKLMSPGGALCAAGLRFQPLLAQPQGRGPRLAAPYTMTTTAATSGEPTALPVTPSAPGSIDADPSVGSKAAVLPLTPFDSAAESRAALAITAALGLVGLPATLWYAIHAIARAAAETCETSSNEDNEAKADEDGESACAPTDVQGSPCVHSRRCSRRVAQLLQGVSGWPIVFAGHSLGAGIGALLVPKVRAALAPLYAAAAEGPQACPARSELQGSAIVNTPGFAVDAASLRLPAAHLIAQLHPLDVIAASPVPAFASIFACPSVAGPGLACVLGMSPLQLRRSVLAESTNGSDAAGPDVGLALLRAFASAPPVLPLLDVIEGSVDGEGVAASGGAPQLVQRAGPGARLRITLRWRMQSQQRIDAPEAARLEWRRRPLVVCVINGDDVIPRISIAALRGLYTRLADPALVRAANAAAVAEVAAAVTGAVSSGVGQISRLLGLGGGTAPVPARDQARVLVAAQALSTAAPEAQAAASNVLLAAAAPPVSSATDSASTSVGAAASQPQEIPPSAGAESSAAAAASTATGLNATPVATEAAVVTHTTAETTVASSLTALLFSPLAIGGYFFGKPVSTPQAPIAGDVGKRSGGSVDLGDASSSSSLLTQSSADTVDVGTVRLLQLVADVIGEEGEGLRTDADVPLDDEEDDGPEEVGRHDGIALVAGDSALLAALPVSLSTVPGVIQLARNIPTCDADASTPAPPLTESRNGSQNCSSARAPSIGVGPAELPKPAIVNGGEESATPSSFKSAASTSSVAASAPVGLASVFGLLLPGWGTSRAQGSALPIGQSEPVATISANPILPPAVANSHPAGVPGASEAGTLEPVAPIAGSANFCMSHASCASNDGAAQDFSSEPSRSATASGSGTPLSLSVRLTSPMDPDALRAVRGRSSMAADAADAMAVEMADTPRAEIAVARKAKSVGVGVGVAGVTALQLPHQQRPLSQPRSHPRHIIPTLVRRISRFRANQCSPRQAVGDLMPPGQLHHTVIAARPAAAPAVVSDDVRASGGVASHPAPLGQAASHAPGSREHEPDTAHAVAVRDAAAEGRLRVRRVPPAFFDEPRIVPDLMAHHSHRIYRAVLAALQVPQQHASLSSQLRM